MEALRSMDARVKLVCLVVYFVAALHARTVLSLGACLVVMAVVAVLVRARSRDVARALMPLASILVLTFIAQVLYFQQGEVVAWLGPIALTREALVVSARMMMGLVCVMGMSIALMCCTAPEELARAFGSFASPLRRAGVRVEGVTFALSVAFGFVPVLADDFASLKSAQEARAASFDGGVRQRLGAYARLFPPLVRSAFRRADTLAESAASRNLSCGVRPTSLHPGRFGLAEASALVVVVFLAAASFMF